MLITAESGVRGQLIDLDTGKPIPKVIWANLDTGSFQAYSLDPSGQFIPGPDGSFQVYWAKARLKFIPDTFVTGPKDLTIRCQNTGESPNECGCDSCRKRLSKKAKQRVTPIVAPLMNRGCQHTACNRVATWMVSDEVLLDDVIQGQKLYHRVKTIGIRYYCSWHYLPSKQFDKSGELISMWDEAMGVRPQ